MTCCKHASGCGAETVDNPQRRNTLKLCSGFVLSMASGLNAQAGEASEARPDAGDLLVRADTEGNPVPLKLSDLSVGDKPIVAFPFDAPSGIVKNGSRLNTIVLLRLPTEMIAEELQTYSVEGVLAYSGICTHQGCAISEYTAKDDVFVCFCHFTQFRPSTGGQVVAGPAPRGLPKLPIKLDGQTLVVAGHFSSKPGVTST